MEPTVCDPKAELIFLSHSGEHSDEARLLAHGLRGIGLTVWLDLDCLEPGKPWMVQIENAIKRSTTFLVYVGTAGIERWVDLEVRTALDRSAREASFRVMPLLGPGVDAESLPLFLRQYQWLHCDPRSFSPEGIRVFLSGALPPTSPAVAAVSRPPFLGLHSFDVADAHLFYGRDKETEQLLEHLQKTSFLCVIGDSGSGKSSLVRAGLIPALHHGRFKTDQNKRVEKWNTAIMRPGNDPLRELAEALPQLDSALALGDTVDAVNEMKNKLALGADQLRNFLVALVPPRSYSLLVVDQFEELFTLVANKKQQHLFIDMLVRATTAPSESDHSIYVVIVLRADFYSKCWEHPTLPTLIAQNLYAVPHIAGDQLMAIIDRPLRVVGGSTEPGLISSIVNEVGDEPGTLPLLEFSLTELWERRVANVLTHAAFEAIGRVRGAIAKHADNHFHLLSPQLQGITPSLFGRLINISSAAEKSLGTRRIIDYGELDSDAHAVVHHFASGSARLLVVGRDSQEHGRVTVEIAHEALIKGWDRLRGWIEQDRSFLIWRQSLQFFVAEWLRTDKNRDALLRGIFLAESQRWALRRLRDLNDNERQFISESLKVHTANKRWRTTAVGVMAVTVSCALAWLIWIRSEAYQISAVLAEGNSLVAAADEAASDWLVSLAVAGRLDDAFRAKTTIERSDIWRRCLFEMAHVLAQLGRTPELKKVLLQIDDKSDRAFVLEREGFVLLDIGRMSDSRELAQEAFHLGTNRSASVTLISLLVRTGSVIEPLRAAHSIADDETRADVLANVAKELASLGRTSEAKMLAEELARDYTLKPVSCIRIVRSLADASLDAEALLLARRQSDMSTRVDALVAVAAALAKSGHEREAEAIANEALIVARQIKEPVLQVDNLGEVAFALVSVGEVTQAIAAVDDIPNSKARRPMLTALKLKVKKDLGLSKELRARLAKEILDTVPRIANAYMQVWALNWAIAVLMDLGDEAGAREAGKKALETALAVRDVDIRESAIEDLFGAEKDAGMGPEALVTALTSVDLEKELEMLLELIRSLLSANNALQAKNVATEAVRIAHDIARNRSSDQSQELDQEQQQEQKQQLDQQQRQMRASMIEIYAAAGMYQEAMKVAKEIQEPDRGQAFERIISDLVSQNQAEQALSIARQINKTEQMFTDLSPVLVGKGRFQEALAWARSIGNVIGQRNALQSIASAYLRVNRREEAGAAIAESLTNIQAIKPSDKCVLQLRASSLFMEAGDRRKALEATMAAAASAHRIASDKLRSDMEAKTSKALAELHQYRQARLIAERCSASRNRLVAFASILLAHEIQRDPRIAKAVKFSQ